MPEARRSGHRTLFQTGRRSAIQSIHPDCAAVALALKAPRPGLPHGRGSHLLKAQGQLAGRDLPSATAARLADNRQGHDHGLEEIRFRPPLLAPLARKAPMQRPRPSLTSIGRTSRRTSEAQTQCAIAFPPSCKSVPSAMSSNTCAAANALARAFAEPLSTGLSSRLRLGLLGRFPNRLCLPCLLGDFPHPRSSLRRGLLHLPSGGRELGPRVGLRPRLAVGRLGPCRESLGCQPRPAQVSPVGSRYLGRLCRAFGLSGAQ